MSDEFKRHIADITNLIRDGFEVNMPDSSVSCFSVKFHGPRGTNYEGGVWSVNVFLASNYPVMHPILQFCDKIYHPNISYKTGTVCVNVLGQAWKDEYDETEEHAKPAAVNAAAEEVAENID